MNTIESFVISDQVLLWAVNVVIHATALTAVSLCIALLFRKTAVTRYWVLCLGMLLVLGSPLISAVIQSRGDSLLTLAPPSEDTPAVATPTPLPTVATGASIPERPTEYDPAVIAEPLPLLESAADSVTSPEPDATTPPPIVAETIAVERSEIDWLRVIGASVALVWAIGSLILLIRMAIGWIRMARILKHAKPIENVELQRAFERACEIAARRGPSGAEQRPPDGLRGGVKRLVLQWFSVAQLLCHLPRRSWGRSERAKQDPGGGLTQNIAHPFGEGDSRKPPPPSRTPERRRSTSPQLRSGEVTGLRPLAKNARRPRLVASDTVSGPIAAGIFGGTVVLPRNLVDQVDAADLADVLVHEVAHVVRRDQIVVLLQNLVAALYWPHPLVKKLNRELAKAREEVCDNFVLAGTEAPAYSRTLLGLAELVQQPTTMHGSVGFFTDRWKLEHRVAGLLDEDRDRQTILSKRGWAFVLALTLGLVTAISVGTITIATAQDTNNESTVASESDLGPMAVSGFVRGPDGDPIAGAKVWLAVTSNKQAGDASRHNGGGILRELGTANQQGRFSFVVDAATIDEIRKRQFSWQTHLLATAEGHGLDWMPLDVFEDNPAPSEKRDTLRARIDKALGDGRFVGRTLKLRTESQPVRGRLVDLEGNRLPNVKVSVESLRQPDIPRLLKAFEMSWKQEVNEALSATAVGVGGLARSELERLIPSVTTDENGEFELNGIGDDQLVTLVFHNDRVEARPLNVLGREMKAVSLPHINSYPSGAKDVFVGREFTFPIGPSVPVEGGVTDYDTGKPVAGRAGVCRASVSARGSQGLAIAT